jgi:hypothetical protein
VESETGERRNPDCNGPAQALNDPLQDFGMSLGGHGIKSVLDSPHRTLCSTGDFPFFQSQALQV